MTKPAWNKPAVVQRNAAMAATVDWLAFLAVVVVVPALLTLGALGAFTDPEEPAATDLRPDLVAMWSGLLQPVQLQSVANGSTLAANGKLLEAIRANVDRIKKHVERPVVALVDDAEAVSPTGPAFPGVTTGRSGPRLLLKGDTNVDTVGRNYRLFVYHVPGDSGFHDWTNNHLDGINCRVDGWDLSTQRPQWHVDPASWRLFRYDGNGPDSGWHDVRSWREAPTTVQVNKQIQTDNNAGCSDAEDTTAGPVRADTERVVSTGRGLKIRKPQQDLRAWVHSRYNSRTPLRRATVNPRSWVWTHLVRDHGFSGEQVNGLAQWEALALHDAVHPRARPLVTPWQ